MKKALSVATGLIAAIAGMAAVAAAPAAAERPTVVDEAQIELAKFGITMFGLDTLTETATECPAVRRDELGFWTGQLGMAATVQGYEVDAYSPDDVEALALFCGVNPAEFVATPDPAAPYAIALEAYNLLDGGTFAQVIARASVEATPVPTPDPALGGEVASWCGESNTPGRTICFSFWHRSGLVLDIFMVGPTAELTAEKSQQLLLSMVDNAVTNLAAYESILAGPTTVAAGPTSAPVPTAAPASTAPAPTVPLVATTAATPLPTAAPVSTVVPAPTIAATVAPISTVAPIPTAVALPTTPGASTVPALNTPTVPGAPTTLPAGFVRVSDDSGSISVAIPSTWTDVQTVGLALDDGTTTPQLVASTDVASYEATFDVPGISIVTAAPIADPQSFVTSSGLTGGCTTITTEPYVDAMFSGVAQIGTSCGSGGGSWKLIVGNTIDGATGVVITLQTASPTDQPAIDTAFQTIVLS